MRRYRVQYKTSNDELRELFLDAKTATMAAFNTRRNPLLDVKYITAVYYAD